MAQILKSLQCMV